MLRRVPIPDRGVSDATPFLDQPGAFAPPGSMLNVRHRGRTMGKRPGWRRLFPQRIGRGGPVQACGVITRAAGVAGYQIDQCTQETAGTSLTASPAAGNIVILDRAHSVERVINFDVTDIGGPAGVSVVAVRFTPDGRYVAAAANYLVGGVLRTTIRLFNVATGEQASSVTISDPTKPIFTNTLCFSSEYLFACVNNTVRAYTWSGGVLSFVLETDLGGWAQEAVQAAVWRDAAGVEWLYVGFDGSSAAGVRTGGTIEGGWPAVHFRSGVMKFRIGSAAAIPIGGSALTQVTFGPVLSSANAFYEAAHGYLRISEPGNSSASPHGCLITALAVDPSDGSVIIGRTNVGIGPDLATYPPDATWLPRATVAKYSAAGVLLWEADTDSIIEAGFGGYFNDIPFTGDPTPDTSVMAVGVTAAGDVLAAGRRTNAGSSAYLLRGSDGVRLAQWEIMGAQPESVRQAAVVLDPSDGLMVVGGDRSTDWEGSGGANAHLWKLDPSTLAIAKHFDIAEDVSALCCDADGEGNLVYGTDAFT